MCMAFGPGRHPCEMSQKQGSMLFQAMAHGPRKPPEKYQKKEPKFFKFMLPGFSQKLFLPPAFVNHLMGEKCVKAILKSPLGKSWHVKVCGDKACKWFGDGWLDFVLGHDLQIGEVLVFRCDGDMVFHVTVLDKSACEKKLPVVSKDNKDHGKQRGTENEKKQPLVWKKIKDNGKKRGQHMSTVKFNSFKKIKTEDVELTKMNTEDVELTTINTQDVELTKMNTEDMELTKMKTEGVELTIYKNLYSQSMGAHHILEKQQSTTEEKTKAFEKANAFSEASKFPNLLKIMTKSNVCYSFVLAIPGYFSGEHLPIEKAKVILWEPKEREWGVSFIPYCSRGFLTGGWGAFSRANNLREGDVCLLELVGECQMQVHIFPSKNPASAQAKRLKKISH